MKLVSICYFHLVNAKSQEPLGGFSSAYAKWSVMFRVSCVYIFEISSLNFSMVSSKKKKKKKWCLQNKNKKWCLQKKREKKNNKWCLQKKKKKNYLSRHTARERI